MMNEGFPTVFMKSVMYFKLKRLTRNFPQRVWPIDLSRFIWKWELRMWRSTRQNWSCLPKKNAIEKGKPKMSLCFGKTSIIRNCRSELNHGQNKCPWI